MDTTQRLPDTVSRLLLALGDSQRQRVLATFLEAGCWELPANEIAERCVPLSRPAVSHHLGLMRRAGLLTSRREGKRIYYTIDRRRIEDALNACLAFLDVCCAPATECETMEKARTS